MTQCHCGHAQGLHVTATVTTLTRTFQPGACVGYRPRSSVDCPCLAFQAIRDIDDAPSEAVPLTRLSYDEQQIQAILKQCEACGLWFYFTNHAATVCGGCRDREPAQAARKARA